MRPLRSSRTGSSPQTSNAHADELTAEVLDELSTWLLGTNALARRGWRWPGLLQPAPGTHQPTALSPTRRTHRLRTRLALPAGANIPCIWDIHHVLVIHPMFRRVFYLCLIVTCT